MDVLSDEHMTLHTLIYTSPRIRTLQRKPFYVVLISSYGSIFHQLNVFSITPKNNLAAALI